jgi:hypothetical protein
MSETNVTTTIIIAVSRSTEKADVRADVGVRTGVADVEPLVDVLVEDRGAAPDELVEHVERKRARKPDARDRDRVRTDATDLTPEQTRDDRAKQRRKDDREQDSFRDHRAQPFIESSSATLIVARLRNSTTRMARPIADSAAATVRMKNTNTWALRIAEIARERDEVRVDREQHQLNRHQQHDDVLAVDEDAGDRDAEQDRAEREEMRKRDHRVGAPVSTAFSDAILTTRTRSRAVTATWRAGSCVLTPTRWRSVSESRR